MAQTDYSDLAQYLPSSWGTSYTPGNATAPGWGGSAASQPSWWNNPTGTESMGGGTDWAKTATALKELLEGANPTQRQGGQQQLQSSGGVSAQSGAVNPRRPESLSELVKLLRNRTDLYMQSATNPQRAAPVQVPRTKGILGF